MEARYGDDGIVVDDPHARQQLYDASGVGHPRDDGTVVLTWVEGLYLLERGDIEGPNGDDRNALLAEPPDTEAIDRWLVYRDLRERGYYVGTTYQPGTSPAPGEVTFAVRPRGAAPTSDEVAHRIAVVDETTSLALADLSSRTLAVADDEGELTYLGIEPFDPIGSTEVGMWDPVDGTNSGDRVLVEEPPEPLVNPAFFGRQLESGGRLLNALEARYLVDQERLTASLPADGDGHRYEVYADLRARDCVPRTGLKFGADFRVYTDVNDADDPGHSAFLVDVRSPDAADTPRALSRAVRLAGGVRKRHVIALADGDTIVYLACERKRL